LKGIFIDISDIRILFDCSLTTAYRKINLIRASLAKKKEQGITIREFCEFVGISEIDFYQGLNSFKKKSY